MSEYGVVTAQGTVRLERLLPGPIERVWAFLTEPEKRRTWFAGGEMEPRVGGKLELFFKHSLLSQPGEVVPDKYREVYETGRHMTSRVTRYEPPRLLAYTFGEQSEVTFELSAQGDKVRLVLTHERLPDRKAMTNVSSGWHSHLAMLAARLEGKEPPAFWAMITRLETEYEARIASDRPPA